MYVFFAFPRAFCFLQRALWRTTTCQGRAAASSRWGIRRRREWSKCSTYAYATATRPGRCIEVRCTQRSTLHPRSSLDLDAPFVDLQRRRQASRGNRTMPVRTRVECILIVYAPTPTLAQMNALAIGYRPVRERTCAVPKLQPAAAASCPLRRRCARKLLHARVFVTLTCGHLTIARIPLVRHASRRHAMHGHNQHNRLLTYRWMGRRAAGHVFASDRDLDVLPIKSNKLRRRGPCLMHARALAQDLDPQHVGVMTSCMNPCPRC